MTAREEWPVFFCRLWPARGEHSRITPSVRRFASEQVKYATTFPRWLGEQNATDARGGAGAVR